MNEKKIGVFSIISVITGILAFIYVIISIMGAPIFICILLGVISILTGIVSFILKNKVALPIIGISLSAVAIIMALIVMVVSPIMDKVKNEVNTVNDIISNQSTNTNTKTNTVDANVANVQNTTNNSISNNTNLNTSNNTNTSTSTSNNTTGTQRVGNNEFGYISIPSTWNKFLDPDSPNTLQYSYGYSYIATLYAMDTTEVSAEDYAKSTMYTMQQENAQNVTGATVTIGQYTAYQVYGYYTDDNTWLVCWHFEAEDGKTHYISIEGTDASNEAFKIPETFSLDK